LYWREIGENWTTLLRKKKGIIDPRINDGKPKHITLSTQHYRTSRLEVGRYELEKLDKFKYLGEQNSKNNHKK